MKNRWHKSLLAAAAAYDTPLPWERGAARQAMIARRKAKMDLCPEEHDKVLCLA